MLLDIRLGNIPLDKLITDSDSKIIELNDLYAKCNLPDDVSKEEKHHLIIKIRKSFWNDSSKKNIG